MLSTSTTTCLKNGRGGYTTMGKQHQKKRLNKKSILVGFAIDSLFAIELAEAGEHRKSSAWMHSAVEPTESFSLLGRVHTHSELLVDQSRNISSAPSASGLDGERDFERYRLHLLPLLAPDENGCDRLRRTDLVGYSNLDT
jgi:hypothetical protein